MSFLGLRLFGGPATCASQRGKKMDYLSDPRLELCSYSELKKYMQAHSGAQTLRFSSNKFSLVAYAEQYGVPLEPLLAAAEDAVENAEKYALIAAAKEEAAKAEAEAAAKAKAEAEAKAKAKAAASSSTQRATAGRATSGTCRYLRRAAGIATAAAPRT